MEAKRTLGPSLLEIEAMREAWAERLPDAVEIYEDQPERGDAQAFVGEKCVGTFSYAAALAKAAREAA